MNFKIHITAVESSSETSSTTDKNELPAKFGLYVNESIHEDIKETEQKEIEYLIVKYLGKLSEGLENSASSFSDWADTTLSIVTITRPGRLYCAGLIYLYIRPFIQGDIYQIRVCCLQSYKQLAQMNINIICL